MTLNDSEKRAKMRKGTDVSVYRICQFALRAVPPQHTVGATWEYHMLSYMCYISYVDILYSYTVYNIKV